MSSLIEKFDDLIQEQKRIKQEFQKKAQDSFKGIVTEFFDANPGVKAVQWRQYTPYFNDGDTCEFGVCDPIFTNAEGEDLEDLSAWGEYEGTNESIWAVDNLKWVMTSDRDYYKETKEKILSGEPVDVGVCDSFARLIGSEEMSDVMLAMFDDHVVVTMTRDGFDVQDFDHD